MYLCYFSYTSFDYFTCCSLLLVCARKLILFSYVYIITWMLLYIAFLDESLTPKKLLHVFSDVSKFWDIGLWDWLGVPDSVWTQIRDCESYSSGDEKKMAVLQYCIHTLPGVSWGRIAGALWRLKEDKALKTIKQYLPGEKCIHTYSIYVYNFK